MLDVVGANLGASYLAGVLELRASNLIKLGKDMKRDALSQCRRYAGSRSRDSGAQCGPLSLKVMGRTAQWVASDDRDPIERHVERHARHQISNRSHVSPNRVSGVTTRILKICHQRLSRVMRRLRPKIQKIKPQRQRDVSLTLENVARIFANRT